MCTSTNLYDCLLYTSSEMEKSKGQMKSRLSYAAGAFGNDVFYATLSTYFIMFVTTHLFNTGDPKQNSHYVLLILSLIHI